jgi:hypothetical protein
MNSRLSLAVSEFSEGRWATESSDVPPLHPTELELVPSTRSSLYKRALFAIARFLVTCCIGVAGTLAWQSYGDAARGMIASSSPWLGWLAPQAAPVVQTDPAASAGPSTDLNQLKAISRDLAVVRQSVDKLAAEVSKVRATKQDTDRTSAPPPPPTGAQAHATGVDVAAGPRTARSGRRDYQNTTTTLIYCRRTNVRRVSSSCPWR